VVVSVKYLAVIMCADNAGEGGILSLVALIQQHFGSAEPWVRRAVALGVLGAALFYCDALITPAISVLSAVEGLEILDPQFHRAVLPVTLGVIAVLFAIQRRGTERVGRLFGPVMILWFATLAVLGGIEIVHAPRVLSAVNPLHGIELFASHPGLSLVIVGAVFLAVTGAEALYADMGHFGKRPVRLAWLVLVWPALVINYFGQGALLLSGTATANPFYGLAPPGWLPALVLLATAATVIASQATISGAFSVTRQAVQLDLLPRVRVLQTSATTVGQIYVPAANLFMFVAVVLFVVGFGSSSALSSAYGASVVGTMIITTLLGALVARAIWKWTWQRIGTLFGLLVLVDLAFVMGNFTKIDDGGWVPLAIAAAMFAMFVTWRDGRQALRAELELRAVPIARLPELLPKASARVPGTAVFLVSQSGFVPTALLRNLEHNKVCHERIVILHLEFQRVPRADDATRVAFTELHPGVYEMRARFGFMETPDVGEALRAARRRGLDVFSGESSFFLGWHLVRARPRPGIAGLKSRAFAYLQRRSAQANEFFRMPARGVVVLATDIEL
jgi:KUP system potassium uptake protein